MERTLSAILGKPNDFKLCKKCNALNWYENDNCHDCGEDKFITSDKAIAKWVDKEYDFWIEEEKYTECEVDNVYYDI